MQPTHPLPPYQTTHCPVCCAVRARSDAPCVTVGRSFAPSVLIAPPSSSPSPFPPSPPLPPPSPSPQALSFPTFIMSWQSVRCSRDQRAVCLVFVVFFSARCCIFLCPLLYFFLPAVAPRGVFGRWEGERVGRGGGEVGRFLPPPPPVAPRRRTSPPQGPATALGQCFGARRVAA